MFYKQSSSIYSHAIVFITKFQGIKLSFLIFSVSPKMRIEHYNSQATLSHQNHNHHQDPWAQSPQVSNVFLIVFFHVSLSCAFKLKLCTFVWHQSLMSSSHSRLGIPRLPVPSIIPIMTSLIFLLSSILHTCPNTLNFLLITAYTN